MNQRDVFIEEITKASHSACFAMHSLKDAMASADAVECIVVAQKLELAVKLKLELDAFVEALLSKEKS